ncbi:MAG TPA: ATP-binding protein [Acidobacteriota bacterium]|nr:ATP-binding protein [Acidobacteriota bacterium]
MNQPDVGRTAAVPKEARWVEKLGLLSCRILDLASRGLPKEGFLNEISTLLMESSGCDAIEVRIVRRDKLLLCRASRDPSQTLYQEALPGRLTETGKIIPCLRTDSDFEKICEEVVRNRCDPSPPYFTPRGSFLTGDAGKPLELSSETCRWAGGRTFHLDGGYRTLAVIPFDIGDEDNGLLMMSHTMPDQLSINDIALYEDTARILGIALAHRRAQVALRERVKELTCLYGLAKLAAQSELPLEDLLQRTVDLLPAGWQYPEIAAARITFDDRHYTAGDFERVVQTQTAAIHVVGRKRGAVDVGYTRETQDLDEGPFLTEERHLIDAVGQELGLLIEGRTTEEDKNRLQEQLRHADRLATIGQLAAGVAHELNEPLAGILGFAQLIRKASELPSQVRADNEKIIAASLYSREIISKLKLFAREAPPSRERVDLNEVVRNGLFFLEARCAKASIELVRILDPGIPTVNADSGQLYQVLTNLVVNAIQAMPTGGRITIRTGKDEAAVLLAVEDTGTGMDESVLQNIFDPFYTTKDIHEGTGLGLAVVHGIISSHGGTISVKSRVGEGTCFEIRLPVENPPNHRREGSDETA